MSQHTSEARARRSPLAGLFDVAIGPEAVDRQRRLAERGAELAEAQHATLLAREAAAVADITLRAQHRASMRSLREVERAARATQAVWIARLIVVLAIIVPVLLLLGAWGAWGVFR